MDGTEVGVLEETDEVSLGGLLESEYSSSLETQVILEVLGNLTHAPVSGMEAFESRALSTFGTF